MNIWQCWFCGGLSQTQQWSTVIDCSAERGHVTEVPGWTRIQDVAVRCYGPRLHDIHELGYSLFLSAWHCLLLVTHFPQPCLRAAEPSVHLWTCRHSQTHQLTPCLSHGLYLSLVQTHKALVGPALHTARPYIYPTLLLRVTNMGTAGGGAGHPVIYPLCGVVLT